MGIKIKIVKIKTVIKWNLQWTWRLEFIRTNSFSFDDIDGKMKREIKKTRKKKEKRIITEN